MKVILIDNYDSFTWNLVHLAAGLGPDVTVFRNDEIDVASLAARQPDAILLSPGPCTPNEAGITLDLVRRLGPCIPIFGVCLGLQAIGQAYGGTIVRAATPMHGKLSTIEHRGTGLFRGLNAGLKAVRYHSLVIRRTDCPTSLNVIAETAEGEIMAASHSEHPVHGVQFHPESIASEGGTVILKNFLDLAAEWNKKTRGIQA
jgi:anthranilate synthase component 2